MKKKSHHEHEVPHPMLHGQHEMMGKKEKMAHLEKGAKKKSKMKMKKARVKKDHA